MNLDLKISPERLDLKLFSPSPQIMNNMHFSNITHSSGNIEKIILDKDTPDTFLRKVKVEYSYVNSIVENISFFNENPLYNSEKIDQFVNKSNSSDRNNNSNQNSLSNKKNDSNKASSVTNEIYSKQILAYNNNLHHQTYDHSYSNVKKNLSKILESQDDSDIEDRKSSHMDDIITNFTESECQENHFKHLVISELRWKQRYRIHKLVKIVMENIKQNIMTVSTNSKVKALGAKAGFEPSIVAAMKYFLYDSDTQMWYVGVNHALEVCKAHGFLRDTLQLNILSIQLQPFDQSMFIHLTDILDNRGMYKESIAASKLAILYSFNCESLQEKIFKTLIYFGRYKTSLLYQLQNIVVDTLARKKSLESVYKILLEFIRQFKKIGMNSFAKKLLLFVKNKMMQNGPFLIEQGKQLIETDKTEGLANLIELLEKNPKQSPLYQIVLSSIEQFELKQVRTQKKSLFTKYYKFLSLATDNLGKDHIFKFLIELSSILCKLGFYQYSINYMNTAQHNHQNSNKNAYFNQLGKMELQAFLSDKNNQDDINNHDHLVRAIGFFERNIEHCILQQKIIKMLLIARTLIQLNSYESANQIQEQLLLFDKLNQQIQVEQLNFLIFIKSYKQALEVCTVAIKNFKNNQKFITQMINLMKLNKMNVQIIEKQVYYQLLSHPQSSIVMLEQVKLCLNLNSKLFNLKEAYKQLNYALYVSPSFLDTQLEFVKQFVILEHLYKHSEQSVELTQLNTFFNSANEKWHGFAWQWVPVQGAVSVLEWAQAHQTSLQDALFAAQIVLGEEHKINYPWLVENQELDFDQYVWDNALDNLVEID